MQQSCFRWLLSRSGLFANRSVTIALLFGIGLTLFLSIYDGIIEKDDLASLDAPILEWVIANQNRVLTTLLQIYTDILSPTAIACISLLGAGLWMWRKKQFQRPLLFISAISLAFASAAVIKTFTARERPSITDLVQSTTGISYSFPSGHVIGIAVFVFVLGYFYCSHHRTINAVASWATIAFVSITIMACSRIYLGYHWLTDVSASIGLAFIILSIVIAVDTLLIKKMSR